MNDLIRERDDRTRKRKKKKRKMDSIIGLSYHDKEKHVMNLSVSKMGDETIRLLDEGYCDQGFVIKKGTLAKYLNGENQNVRGWQMGDDGWEQTDILNLTDDFVGHVNVGHQDFATYPIIVGEWNRADLSLVDIENERKGLNIVPRINEDLNVVKDLKAMPYDIGISAEFYYHVNSDDTETLMEATGEYIPVIDEIFIFAYGLVGECGNVNSSGLELKGATMSKPNMEQLAMEVDVKDDPAADEATPTEGTVELTDDTASEPVESGEPATDDDEPAADDDDIEPAADDDEDSEPADEGQGELSADDDVSNDPADETDPKANEPEDDESNEGGVEDADNESGNEDEADEATLSFEDLVEEIKALKAEVERLKDIEAKYAALKKSHRRATRKLAEEKEAKAEFFAKTGQLFAEPFENEGEAEKEEAEEAMRLAKEKEYYRGDGIAD